MAAITMITFDILYLLFLIYPAAIICSEILSCGGFIKSDYEIKFSRVELKLYSKQGSLKYQTDCAPNNGYYFIPLYDKGEYVLKVEPPSGWSFEPTSISLHVDGVNDACSQGQDINFAFTGFSVSGKVISKGSSDGPTGVSVVLKKDKKVVKETLTTTAGQFIFSRVPPDEYSISVNHPTWKFERSQIPVIVTQDNEKILNSIVVSGYDVTGHVESEGEPIRGVNFLLFGSEFLKSQGGFEGCDKSYVKGFSGSANHRYICHVTSGLDGKFVFPSVIPGSYELLPFYKGEHIEFDVSPSSLSFTIGHNSFVLKEAFKVQGFSVSGRILKAGKTEGIKGARIFLDGREQAVTQSDGQYHLENMKTGSYKLEVLTPNYYFDPIVVKVTPNTPRLPDIVANKYDVCGRFTMSLSDIEFSLSKRSLIVTEKGKSGGNQIYTNDDGEFCTVLPKGTFSFKAEVTREESESGLQFVPDEKFVTVIDRPILDLVFSQFSATISGSVKCIQDCGDLGLRLSPARGNGDGFEIVAIEKGSFSISNLLPGEYQLTVLKPEWCWKNDVLEFTVSHKDISGLNIEHTGYLATFELTHAAEVEVTTKDVKRTLQLTKGSSTECLPSAGIYVIKPSGCHMFQEDMFKFDTAKPNLISMTATKHLVTGNVVTKENVSDIKLLVTREWNGIVETENITLEKSAVKDFTFSFWAYPHSSLRAVPSSNLLLFNPRFGDLQVEDDCLLNAVSFVGKTGLFINGIITPPLSGVSVKVFTEQDKDSKIPIKETETDANGKFVVGPLIEDSNYFAEAEKEGYTFESSGKLGHFKAFKLAEVFVKIVDENQQGLTGVLVSLSGGTDYRKNSATQSDKELQFLGLGPGQYFLRPVMKEYRFDPPSQMISVNEGATVNVTIKGKRVAFSCFGLMNSLTGEAEPGLVIEATGEGSETCKQYQEEAISEADGSFRIRGLQPNCNYNIHMKEGMEENQHVERVSPKEKIITVLDKDINSIRLIVLRHFNQMDVSGYVQTVPEFLSTLKVRLFREDSPDQASQTITLGQSSFFHLSLLPMDNRSYLLRLDSSLPSSQYHLDLPSVNFKANTTYRHFNFIFAPRQRNSEQEMAQGSLLILPLVLVITLLLFNYNKVLPVFGQIGSLAQNLLNPAKISSSSDSGNTESLSSKRRTKLRRI